MRRFRNAIVYIVMIPMMYIVSSCIEITQDIVINADKSGKFSLKIDLGMLQFANMNSLQGTSGMMKNLQGIPPMAVEKLSGMKGITGIENLTNEESGLYGFSFHFDNDKSFNKAIYQFAEQQKFFFMPDYIKIKKKKVNITDISPFIKKANAMSEKQSAESFISSQISDYIKVTTQLFLPRPVRDTRNLRSKVENQQVTLTATMSELIKGIDYGNTVKY